jgi:nicotinamidase-related amidase
MATGRARGTVVPLRRSPDLHGNVPDASPVAVLLIDLINDLEFPEGRALLPRALAAARRVAHLKAAARRHRVPVIYVNDNFGRWRSDFGSQVRHCLEDGVRGAPIARLLAPDDRDYFVLKPKHSGFYSTTLDLLLLHLQARTLILTGIATEYCVLFTAVDAYVRDYGLVVPADCVASADAATHRRALRHMKDVLKADIRASRALDLSRVPAPAVQRGARRAPRAG